MKKLYFLLIVLFLCGCATKNNVLYTKNPNCTSIKEVTVFQVVDNGALAITTAKEPIIVYLPKSEKYMLYDGVKIRRQNNECMVYDGVYKYKTSGIDQGVIKYLVNKKETGRVEYSANEREKTVPIVKFDKRWLDKE